MTWAWMGMWLGMVWFGLVWFGMVGYGFKWLKMAQNGSKLLPMAWAWLGM